MTRREAKELKVGDKVYDVSLDAEKFLKTISNLCNYDVREMVKINEYPIIETANTGMRIIKTEHHRWCEVEDMARLETTPEAALENAIRRAKDIIAEAEEIIRVQTTVANIKKCEINMYEAVCHEIISKYNC